MDSALHALQNDWLYDEADLWSIAASHASHIAQAQAFLNGNTRTATEAASVFLKGNGVSTTSTDTYLLYKDMIAVAERRMNKAGLAEHFRTLFGGQ